MFRLAVNYFWRTGENVPGRPQIRELQKSQTRSRAAFKMASSKNLGLVRRRTRYQTRKGKTLKFPSGSLRRKRQF